jgi:hypothetical protein
VIKAIAVHSTERPPKTFERSAAEKIPSGTRTVSRDTKC